MAFDTAAGGGGFFLSMGCCLAGCEKGASGSDDAKGNALTRFETFESDFNKPTWN